MIICLHKDLIKKNKGEYWITESQFATDLFLYIEEAEKAKGEYWMPRFRFSADIFLYLLPANANRPTVSGEYQLCLIMTWLPIFNRKT